MYSIGEETIWEINLAFQTPNSPGRLPNKAMLSDPAIYYGQLGQYENGK